MAMDQADIDALLNGNFDIAGDSAPKEEQKESAFGGSMAQDDIDALLNTSFSPDDSPSSSTPRKSSVDQNLIDELLDSNQFAGVNDSANDLDDDELDSNMASLLAEIQQTSGGGKPAEVNIDELLNEIQPSSGMGGTQMNQGDIQSLINSVQSAVPSAVTAPDAEIDVNFLLDMQLNVTFEVGRSKMKIGDLLSLGQGSVIELHRLVGEDLDLFVSGKLIAKGEVVVVNEKFGVRILEIVTPEERIRMMGGMDRLN
ncbi:MAG: flagellar motor switch protein FliN [SAR324 cluster bacterium]|nr:flagellar motor switch protein FliN [SAR324 cluster bacterium]